GALRRGLARGSALHRQGPDATEREQQCPPAALVHPLPPPHWRRLPVARDGRGDHGPVRLLPLQRRQPHSSVSRVKPSVTPSPVTLRRPAFILPGNANAGPTSHTTGAVPGPNTRGRSRVDDRKL